MFLKLSICFTHSVDFFRVLSFTMCLSFLFRFLSDNYIYTTYQKIFKVLLKVLTVLIVSRLSLVGAWVSAQ